MDGQLKTFSVKMGADYIGVVCATDYWPKPEEIAFNELGFTDWFDYKQYYTDIRQYAKQHPTLVADTGYDGQGLMLRTPIIQDRNALRRIYQFDLVGTRLLFLFPTIEQVEESFGYKKLSPWINFWFCSNWDG